MGTFSQVHGKTGKHMYGAVFLDIAAVFNHNATPVAAQRRPGTDIHIAPDDYIARHYRLRMDERRRISHRPEAFECVKHGERNLEGGRISDQGLAGAETGSLEKGHMIVMLVPDLDQVYAGTPPVMHFPGLRRELVAHVYRLGKSDGYVESYRHVIPVIAGEGKSAVCQGEWNASMDNPETVDHFLADHHPDATVSFANFQDFDAHPLAELVVFQHVVHHILVYVFYWHMRTFDKNTIPP
jgi:hypothetical protein